MRALIEDTAGVFRLLRYLVDAIVGETPDMTEMREAGCSLTWLMVVAWNLSKKMTTHFGSNLIQA